MCNDSGSKYLRTKSGNSNDLATEFPPSIADNDLFIQLLQMPARK
jgi:hypothetical protein